MKYYVAFIESKKYPEIGSVPVYDNVLEETSLEQEEEWLKKKVHSHSEDLFVRMVVKVYSDNGIVNVNTQLAEAYNVIKKRILEYRTSKAKEAIKKLLLGRKLKLQN